ncbi:MAG: protein kinase [Sterolibacterium sp.]
MNDAQHIVERWLVSGRTIRLCGLDLKPRPHPALPGTPQSIARGQGTVFFLDQPDHNNTWLLKIFAPSKRPADVYLNAVADRLPGSLPFFSAKQRRLLQSHHLNWAFSDYRDPELVGCINGTILMPRVPGRTWASLADDLRDGQVELDATRRIGIAIHLADCVEQLETVHCAHRDLSAGNVFVTDDGQVYLIDCDCLFHPDITYPTHTSPGTNGYIAPFLHLGGADYDARGSWHPLADRFALAILIAEFLLVEAGTPIQEDGSLFNQQSLMHGDPSVQRVSQLLATIHPRLAGLFQQTLAAHCYDQCPAPTDWISALRHHQRYAGKRQPASRVRCHCGTCGTSVWLAVTKLQELEQKNRAVLCQACLRE